MTRVFDAERDGVFDALTRVGPGYIGEAAGLLLGILLFERGRRRAVKIRSNGTTDGGSDNA